VLVRIDILPRKKNKNRGTAMINDQIDENDKKVD
jgi:hypothetical protein